MTKNAKVPIGPSSVLGWLAAAAGFITTTVQSIETGGALVSGPGKWPAILGAVSLAATNAGRQLQAAHLGKAATVAGDIAKVPAVLQTLAAQAQANVALVNDHVDSAAVPYSTSAAQTAAPVPQPQASPASAPPVAS